MSRPGFLIRTAEIVSVGTELLLGQTLDTNAAFLSRELAELGISTYRHTVVGDNPARLEKAIREALEDNDLVLMTGGLGPTDDDLTAEIAASIMDVPLVKDAVIHQELNRRYPDQERYDFSRYPLLPQGARAFPNDNGTAPGSLSIFLWNGRQKAILLLPGPPAEMEPMFLNRVKESLAVYCPDRFIHRYVRIYGIGESRAESLVSDLLKDQTRVTLAPYASASEVVFRISQKLANPHEEDLTEAMVQELLDRFGDHVFEVGPRSLETVLADLLRARGKTVAFAESCTAGMASSILASVSGASRILQGGFVSYQNAMKERMLEVPGKILEEDGPVSLRCAQAMAEGCLERTGADYALSFTGIAGPGGGTDETPVGTVWIGLACRGGETLSRLHHFGGGRELVRLRAVYSGYDLLRRHLTGL